MKNVLMFMLGMATTVVAIRLVTKDGDNYDDFYDLFEEDADMFFNQPRKPIETAAQKSVRERKEAIKALLAEQDYELTSLSHAIKTQNATEIQRSKARLSEIQHELETMK